MKRKAVEDPNPYSRQAQVDKDIAAFLATGGEVKHLSINEHANSIKNKNALLSPTKRFNQADRETK